MKRFPTCLGFILLFAIALTSSSQLHAQQKISTENWQADLRFLQQTVHTDYPFLFKKITAEKFDEQVEALAAAIPNLQEHEIIVGLSRIVSAFEYGHTSLPFGGTKSINFHTLPINLYHFSDGIYVEGAHQDYKSILGAKVIKVEGQGIKKVLKAIRPVVPVENDQFFKGYGLRYLNIPEVLHAQGITKSLKESITFTLKVDGKIVEQEVQSVPMQRFPLDYGFAKNSDDWLSSRDQSSTPNYLKELDKIYYYEYLPATKTVYVRYSQVQPDPSEDIASFYKRVFEFIEENEVEKLVIDVRLNGGGNNYNNKAVIAEIMKCKKINQPGKFFAIIGRRTFSACQNLINEFENYTNVVFVGEPSAENINFYGDNRTVELPKSQIPVRLSWAWWQDKPQWENADWTVPHLAVDMSFAEYTSNQDPVLEAALNFSDNSFILNVSNYFIGLFSANKLELLESEAVRMVADPNYKYYDFEGEFNNAGYRLMNGNQLQEAIYVFQLNAKLFPDSPNCYDSLAEAHWKSKDTSKAIELYNKALAMDPDGPTGENARAMLKQIEAGQ